MNLNKECYQVGALLYAPALNGTVAASVMAGKFQTPYSMALCLEDTVAEEAVPAAEGQLLKTLEEIQKGENRPGVYLPKIFIRVREPEQLKRLLKRLEPVEEVVTGFIFPKYSLNNANAYHRLMEEENRRRKRPYYMMPILESGDLIDYGSRRQALLELKKRLDEKKEYVLNVRVGGNDFCNQFAVRRHCNQTIYDIIPIAGLLGDILTVFGRDYVVSGPVLEFFSGSGNQWSDGLRRELELDRLNGFVGKTVIHPKQIPVVNESLQVSQGDYLDAKSILDWEDKGGLCVLKSAEGERMNEVKTHENWARKTLLLAELYGVENSKNRE